MNITSERILDGGTIERDFTLDGVPGVLWMPERAATTTPVPLVLLGHPGGLRGRRPRLETRAIGCAGLGFAAATIELPGSGERSPIAAVDQARVELRQAISEGEQPSADVVDRLILPLVDQAVPEWQAVIDAVLALPEIGGPVGISGGVIAIGVRLAAV